MADYKAVIMMGSSSDREFADKIATTLGELGVPYTMRIASAHRTPTKVLGIIGEMEKDGSAVVYITVAGRSNALSGMVDAQSPFPVIACPPYSGTFSGVDVYSSLRMPNGVAPVTILEPENAALVAAKMLALLDAKLHEKIKLYQQNVRDKVEQDDIKLRNEGCPND